MPTVVNEDFLMMAAHRTTSKYICHIRPSSHQAKQLSTLGLPESTSNSWYFVAQQATCWKSRIRWWWLYLVKWLLTSYLFLLHWCFLKWCDSLSPWAARLAIGSRDSTSHIFRHAGITKLTADQTLSRFPLMIKPWFMQSTAV